MPQGTFALPASSRPSHHAPLFPVFGRTQCLFLLLVMPFKSPNSREGCNIVEAYRMKKQFLECRFATLTRRGICLQLA